LMRSSSFSVGAVRYVSPQEPQVTTGTPSTRKAVFPEP